MTPKNLATAVSGALVTAAVAVALIGLPGSSSDTTGACGPTGVTGPTGPTGPSGPSGPVGPIGAWAWAADSAPLDPQNATLSPRIAVNMTRPNLAMTDYGVTAVDAGPGDPEYVIPRTQQGGSITVRIPLGSIPTFGSDHHLTVRDVERGIETDFWQARYDATTQRITSTSAAVRFTLGAVNEQTTGWGGDAANTPLRRGLVTGEDLKTAMDANGALPYTLQFSTPNIASPASAYRFPGLHNAPTGDNSSLWEGTWVRLDPTFNVETSGLPAWQKVIARTLQRRGAILRDNGGSSAVYGKRNSNWSAAGLSGTSVSFSTAFPWNRLQVLKAPTP